MDVAALDAEVAATKKRLFDLRIAQATRQEFKPSEFNVLRKKVAQLLTVRREKTPGTARAARQAAKNALLAKGELVR